MKRQPLTTKALPLLYGITDIDISGCTSHFEAAKRLMESGVELVQLRSKGSSDAAFYEEAVRSVRLSVSFHARVIVNDRVDIALASGAHGVHLGQDDLPPEKARTILGNMSLIGVSTHSLEEAMEASRKRVDYIAVGPIYSTQTKESKNVPVGSETLAEIRKVIRKPIVGIGGINLENASEVMRSGADTVAVISDLLGAQDISLRAQQYFDLLRSLRRI